jgi:hypothetical protein
MTTTMRYLTLFASLAFMITSQIISASEPTTWDYKVLSVASDDADALQAQLVSLGNQG